jgi:polyhydroxyalkanoate synthesis repressor PhaR
MESAIVRRVMPSRLIRKYENRRLYDSSCKRYVNLDEIAQMVRDGDDIQVVDAKSGEDLTRGILTQIIVEDARSRDGGLPLEILRQLVVLSDKAKNELLMWYLRTAFETYRRAQEAPIEFLRNLFGQRAHGEAAEVEELRRRVEDLERQLRDRTPPAVN